MTEIDTDELLVLDWHQLSPSDIDERIDWIRRSAVAGVDWGYCEELMTCVLKNPQTSMLYKLRWFESGKQELVDKPARLGNHRAGLVGFEGING